MKSTLTYYMLDITTKEGKARYAEIKKLNKMEGIEKPSFENHNILYSLSSFNGIELEILTNWGEVYADRMHVILPGNTTQVNLIFNWAEYQRNGGHIREGYYMSQPNELKALRDNTHQCGFCNHQTTIFTNPFCDKCIDRKDLAYEDLYKLYLSPVSVGVIDRRHMHVPKWLTTAWNNTHVMEPLR